MIQARLTLVNPTTKSHWAWVHSFDRSENNSGRIFAWPWSALKAPRSVQGKTIPQDEASIRQRLKTLPQEITSHHADLLELLVRFDDLEGWRTSGTRHCAAWMNPEIGVGMQSGWEYLRVGRKLRTLQTLKALSRAGKDISTPSKRPGMKGAGPIARETARRIACDCSLSIIGTTNGEPVDIGRKSRIWPNAMARAIRERDQHCVWPGCTQTHHLHIHHLRHWADGGATSVQNGAALCASHQALVHEGVYTLQRVEDDDQQLN